ncbi:MAG: hypothetical protein J0L93_01600 [Deltaproteobacteria bacterium]|nr:hypothetical protein [Deltaproteobacteria bacterium]
MSRVFGFLILALTISTSVFADEPVVNAEPDLSSPRAAAFEFSIAKDLGDAARIQAVLADKPTYPLAQVIKIQALAVGQLRALTYEAIEKFGKETKKFFNESGKEEFFKRIENADEKITDDTATLTLKISNEPLKGEKEETMNFRKVNGNKWKVSLADNVEYKKIKDEKIVQLLLQHAALNNAAKKTREELKADKYKTYDEMITGFNVNLRENQNIRVNQPAEPEKG